MCFATASAESRNITDMQHRPISEFEIDAKWRTVGVLNHGAAKLLCGRLASSGIAYRIQLDGRLMQVNVRAADLNAALDLAPASSLPRSPPVDDVAYWRYCRLLIVLPLGSLIGASLQHVTAISQTWPIAVGAIASSFITEIVSGWNRSRRQLRRR